MSSHYRVISDFINVVSRLIDRGHREDACKYIISRKSQIDYHLDIILQDNNRTDAEEILIDTLVMYMERFLSSSG